MNLNMIVGQDAGRVLCRYTQSTLTASCLLNRTDCYVRVNQARELVAFRV